MDEGGRPGEFELIRRYFRPLAAYPGAFDLADDAASVGVSADEDVVITVDLLAEGVHFFAADPPEAIAAKALRVNLSDLAAKGAEPVCYFLGLALRSDWTEDWVARFADGLRWDQEAYGIALAGGDTLRAAGGTTISVTAVGRLPKGTMVHRSGARPGDTLFVTGTIGDAALGLRLRLGTIEPGPAGEGASDLLDRYLYPSPRLALAPALRRYASAAMDVSDGLIGDFGHICEASGVAGVIRSAAMPLSEPARRLVAADPTAFESVLTGGDDYEILATVPEHVSADFSTAAAALGVQVSAIGRITSGKGTPVVLDRFSRPLALSGRSYDHFR